MKKILVLSMLVSFVMICSCQKKDSAAQQELAQRKTELDTREEELAQRKNVLDEREKALNQREKELDQRERSLAEKAKMNARPTPTDVQDPAQVQAEKEMIMQQLSAGHPDPVQMHAEKDAAERKIEQQPPQSQAEREELRRAKQSKMELSPSYTPD